MEEPNNFVDIDFDKAFPVSVEEDDDASSVATDATDEHADQAFPDKEFPTFDDLRASVSAFSNVGVSQMGDNSRCLPSPSLPTSWLRRMFLDVQGSIKYSGFLYCKCKQSPSLDCSWRVNYKLMQSGQWAVNRGSSVWTHNHDLALLAGRSCPAPSGLVHLKVVNQLSIEHKAAIISFLDAGLTVKCIRFKFRAKFPGFELRARCCKTVKQGYLKDKYGADRHQMTKFLEQLKRDCNPDYGGVCDMSFYENMEVAEVYFQMPLLRAIGVHFGKFSVIDMSHGMTMYERNTATYNVRFEYTQTSPRLLTFLFLLSILKLHPDS